MHYLFIYTQPCKKNRPSAYHRVIMEDSFAKYVTEHRSLLYKVRRMFERDDEAQKDLLQDILYQLWKAFPRYDTQFKWTTWAYRIALNVAISNKRNEKKSLPVVSDVLPDIPADAGVVEAERSEALWRAIDQLNPAEKALLLLYFDEMSYSAIADISGLTETNVGVRISRIKNKLKSMLSHENGL